MADAASPNLGMQYKYTAGSCPRTIPAELAHAKFLESFGAEGNVLLIGVEDDRLRTAEGLMQWHALAEEIRALRVTFDGQPTVIIDSVFAITNAFEVAKHPTDKSFVLQPLAPDLLDAAGDATITDERAGEIVDAVRGLPFYDGLLYNPENDATLMMVVFNHDMLNSAKRGRIVEDIIEASTDGRSARAFKRVLAGCPSSGFPCRTRSRESWDILWALPSRSRPCCCFCFSETSPSLACVSRWWWWAWCGVWAPCR